MSERTRRFHPLIVGASAGLASADLLVGLNPETLGFPHVWRLLASCAALGALLAAPLALVPPRGPSTPGGAWLLLSILAAAFAAFVELQRELYYPFLKNGARRVLVVTTLVCTAAAISALLALAKRPGPRGATRLLVFFAALGLLPTFFGRRSVEQVGLASPSPLPRTPTRSLLVVGFDGLSWDVLSALASEGALPVFSRLLSAGAAGPLQPLEPYDRAALWTTAATGKRPMKHGVVSHVVYETPAAALRLLPRVPGASAARPAFLSPREGAPARHSLAFWEVLARRGHEAAVLNWPYAPARSGLVLWASESLFDGDPSPLAALPPEPGARARLFRVAVGNLDHPLARALAPAELDAAETRVALEGAARDLSVVGAALAAVPTGPQNVSTIVLSGAARVSELLGPAAAAGGYWGVPIRRVDARARSLRAYYRFLDDALGDLLAREGKDRTLCLFAPVGYGAPPPLTAVERFLEGKEPRATAEGSPDGFVLLFGSGIRAGVRLTSANVVDLAPTLLVLAGEPIARDMDGRVLSEAFDERFAESASVPILTTFEPDGPQ